MSTTFGDTVNLPTRIISRSDPPTLLSTPSPEWLPRLDFPVLIQSPISSPFKPIPIKTQKSLNAEHKCPKWSSRGICVYVQSTDLTYKKADLFPFPLHPTAAAVSCARIGGYNCTPHTPFTRCWPADCSSHNPRCVPDASIDPDSHAEGRIPSQPRPHPGPPSRPVHLDPARSSARPACPFVRRRSQPYSSTLTRSPHQSAHDDPEAASTTYRPAVGACELIPGATLCMLGWSVHNDPTLLAPPFSTVIPPPMPTPTPTRSSLFSLFPSPRAPGATMTIIVVRSSDAAHTQRSAFKFALARLSSAPHSHILENLLDYAVLAADNAAAYRSNNSPSPPNVASGGRSTRPPINPPSLPSKTGGDVARRSLPTLPINAIKPAAPPAQVIRSAR
ncbi:hypothetical protein B0H14DRAFT_3465148 [Mycena olivaceomarginata]|nr:hypothetical protein B0H14DRAFT_3465148 [Mycena olivaceomarginata]